MSIFKVRNYNLEDSALIKLVDVPKFSHERKQAKRKKAKKTNRTKHQAKLNKTFLDTRRHQEKLKLLLPYLVI